MSRKPCIFSSTIASVLEGLAFICFSLVDRQSVSRFSQSPLNTKHNKHTYIHIYVNAYLCISMYFHAYIHTQGTYYQCVFLQCGLPCLQACVLVCTYFSYVVFAQRENLGVIRETKGLTNWLQIVYWLIFSNISGYVLLKY